LLDEGVTVSEPLSNGLRCSTCHDNIGEFTLHTVNEVSLPSGATVTFGEEEASNLCLNCHQGRESTVSVNAAIDRAGVGDDEVSDELNFRNPHYFAAGATLFGGEAHGAYEFEGMEYDGQLVHTRRFDECTDCHNEHSLEIRSDLCSDCHESVEAPDDIFLIRFEEDEDDPGVDYNGNGDSTEPIKAEIDALHADLLTYIQAYAADTLGTPIVYNTNSYPYWFTDLNDNGVADPDESNRDNGYAMWTPNLLRAAYNYQYVAKDPGAFAHNPDYILQVLYDSIQAIGGDDAVASYTRSPVR
jgi:Zn finger protein HypA/HybF involved in hydrogenase expression